jgi:hypothetical protein
MLCPHEGGGAAPAGDGLEDRTSLAVRRAEASPNLDRPLKPEETRFAQRLEVRSGHQRSTIGLLREWEQDLVGDRAGAHGRLGGRHGAQGSKRKRM